ncbi:phosphate/phosphite/phosphonate ABC transporter substrate-binding protein [Pseudomarimonas salicorniae]|uniref:Phosphate/phosphite/phosphonate ABC transporter substrate-binding protein n=1 Tax=Pseudomarimonas salicorniae TaxID=2933270 RepID=A0ABT0GFX7_9GAMM|nr:PhnD/SsuA/transferrin family substrate-binding protein [Lysobacter sp. CAU 1642]MCK7592947.1 phosphate/phosphite/phosphonate ABC transporter substrate-binding protein [Lysobacter sp. CAU 1642]
MLRTIVIAAAAFAACMPGASQAQAPAERGSYQLAVEPSYPPEQAREVYKPLLEYLEKETGQKFELVAVRNYHFYWRDLRGEADIDFAFEDAHFTDYRMKRDGFVPLARKAEPSVFVLMASPETADQGLSGLIGRSVVSMPSPSLGFATLAELFTNPVSQPEIRSEASTWRDGVEMVFSGDAVAAMVPEFIAQQYPNLVEVARSKAFPGAAFSASPEVPEDVRQSVRDALLKLTEDPASFDILAELGMSAFVAAEPDEYDGSESILSAFFGYTPPN